MKFFRIYIALLEKFDFETLKQAVAFANQHKMPEGTKLIKITSHTDSDGRIRWKQRILKRY